MMTAALRARAGRFLAPNVRASLFNPQVRPHGIGDTDTFWYRHESADGIRLVMVDAATGT